MFKIKASEIKVILKHDDCPDLSWLGTFSNQKETDQAIRHNGGRHEYNWFNPGNAGEDYTLEYAQQDYDRMTAYNDGEWYMQGVKAGIELHVPNFPDKWYDRLSRKLNLSKMVQKSWTIRRIETPGLWGVESDSDYWIEIWIDEIYALKRELALYGIKIINDRPDYVVAEPPFDREAVYQLNENTRHRLDRALRSPSILSRAGSKVGRTVSSFLDGLYQKRMKEIANF